MMGSRTGWSLRLWQRRIESRKVTDERILERLLALNLERAAEEEEAAKVKRPKTSRGKRDDEML
jgi:hypothetical protein